MSDGSSNNDAPHIRDHYEVLSVPLDASLDLIKKAYRKLALKHHPDKATEKSVEEFHLIQEAYETLSDPAERKWYDEHRTALLRGWSHQGGQERGGSFLFDVVPYQHASCFQGYDNDNNRSFYNVYGNVFASVAKEEEQSDHVLPTDFGNADTTWEHVLRFYKAWENFSSTLSFAWEDVYKDQDDTYNRRIRRAMAEENKRARRAAKKERNADIIALVRFVKRRDLRIQEYTKHTQQAQQAKLESIQKQEAERKQRARQAREEWKLQAEQHMDEMEQQDLQAGRIRLADLDSSDEEYGQRKKGKKKKKGRKKNRGQIHSDDEKATKPPRESNAESKTEDKEEEANSDSHPNIDDENEHVDVNADDQLSSARSDEQLIVEESSEESEEEPDIWRCVACRKDFKSKGQMENHLKSKKHKEAYRKYEKKMKAQEETIMNDMMEELDMEY